MGQVGGSGYAVSRGALKHGIMVVGEALGEDEAEAGKPFIGKAGKFLDRLLSRIKDPATNQPLSSDDFLITNVVRCRPPDNKLAGKPWEKSATEQCAPYLRDMIALQKPKVIIALGATAMKWFIGEKEIKKYRGYVFHTPYGLVIPTLHPAFLTRGNFGLTRLVQLDFKKALFVARNGPVKKEKHYILKPSPMDLAKFVEDFEKMPPDTPLSFDIETPYAATKDEDIDPENEEVRLEDDPSYTIDRISFSHTPFTAISFPWIQPYIGYARRLLASPNPKYCWNGMNFDIPRLDANDAPVNGLVYDGMDMWHFAEPAFPMGLKSCATIFCPDMEAWSLQSHSRPEYYSCADSDVALRCIEGIKKTLEEKDRMRIFQRHFVDLGYVLRKMSRRGIPVNMAGRERAREEFLVELEQVNAHLQEVVPTALKPRKVFKKTEEQLRKSGSWQEGRMVSIIVHEPRKHEHIWACVNSEQVKCVGEECGKLKKKPKKSFCTCGTCPVPVRKKKVKKDECGVCWYSSRD